MALTKLEIQGYRGFKERGILEFAVPNGKEGSGLTIVTGPNNAGKSCILECLRARSGNNAGSVSFTAGTRNAEVEAVEIKYTVNGHDEAIKSIAKGSSETKSEGIDPNFHVFVLPSRRTFNPYFGRGGDLSREQYTKQSGLPPQRSSVISHFEYRLFKTIKNPDSFNMLLKEVLGFDAEWTIDQADSGQYFLKFYNGKHPHSSDGMGEGIVSIFGIVDSLYDSVAGNLVAIDEPELSLHPSLQKRLARILRRYSADRQIVIATHSPYFVDLRSLTDGGQLVRVTTTTEGTRIHPLSASSKTAISQLSEGNLYNPHVFGLDAKELFFQEDRIILTEGQEDVLLYPQIAEQIQATITGSFFGWGVGGVSNIEYLCSILKDLGFTRVAALLDGDKVSEAEKLRADFPDYFFECIPAKDIRTKPARKATEEVEGLLDNTLILKPQFSTSLTKLFKDLHDHMTL